MNYSYNNAVTRAAGLLTRLNVPDMASVHDLRAFLEDYKDSNILSKTQLERLEFVVSRIEQLRAGVYDFEESLIQRTK